MSNEANKIDPEAWKYAQKAMTWYGWGSPIGTGHRRDRGLCGALHVAG